MHGSVSDQRDQFGGEPPRQPRDFLLDVQKLHVRLKKDVPPKWGLRVGLGIIGCVQINARMCVQRTAEPPCSNLMLSGASEEEAGPFPALLSC